MNSEKQIPVQVDEAADARAVLKEVYEALSEKGYNPIGQIVGYLLSEDPTYITNYKNARALVRRIDRDELLNALVKNYLGVK
ncbi:MAG: IreB family regulatory phosphoprotein [Clostridia bacterium]|nr:IreB family regulatory phosphoprotein [Clostridia bacterium]